MAKTLEKASDEQKCSKVIDLNKMRPQLGVVVPPHALSVPFESVKELGDYWCEVTVRNVHYSCITSTVKLSFFASFFRNLFKLIQKYKPKCFFFIYIVNTFLQDEVANIL